jgi:homoserine kinase
VPRRVFLRLPATSANVGPGFDTAALALGMHLEIEATPAHEFSIAATGRNADICSRLEGNLLLETYCALAPSAPPLSITMRNGIPLGMGCGSSAATRLAGVALAASFGELGWTKDCDPERFRERILGEAAKLEGHPDNAAACWLGGFTVSATCDGQVIAHSIRPPGWHALIAMPRDPLATSVSRKVLPDDYSRHHVVHNLQRVALLTAAFASGRADLLLCATDDAIHQPYRSSVCPLLGRLLPLAGHAGILSVTLSGAGPAVLLLLASPAVAEEAEELVRAAAADLALKNVIACGLEAEPASHTEQ